MHPFIYSMLAGSVAGLATTTILTGVASPIVCGALVAVAVMMTLNAMGAALRRWGGQ